MKIFILTNFVWILLVGNGNCSMSPYKWMHHKSYGSTVNLEPLFDNTQCTDRSQCYWLLPDKYTRINYPSNTSKYSISSNGILTIVNIQSSDNGIYHFFKMNNGDWVVSKALLNLHGAPFDSLWLEYWPNVLGGFIAMAVVLISFGLILLANKYRYRPPTTFSTRHLSQRPDTIPRTNPVFTADDNRTITSRRSSTTSNATNLRIERL